MYSKILLSIKENFISLSLIWRSIIIGLLIICIILAIIPLINDPIVLKEEARNPENYGHFKPFVNIIQTIPKNIILIILLLLVILCLILFKVPKSNSPVQVMKIRPLKNVNNTKRIFEIILCNPSNSQILLSEFIVRWKYHKGMETSIEQGLVL